LLAFTTREVSTSEIIEFIGNSSFLEEEAFKEDEGLEEEEEEKPSKRPILFVSSPRSLVSLLDSLSLSLFSLIRYSARLDD
jgi:hypothetical protein